MFELSETPVKVNSDKNETLVWLRRFLYKAILQTEGLRKLK